MRYALLAKLQKLNLHLLVILPSYSPTVLADLNFVFFLLLMERAMHCSGTVQLTLGSLG